MIVVATADFELYHELVAELRERRMEFTTIEPGEDVPDAASAVITTAEESVATPEGAAVVEASADAPRAAVEEAIAHIRGDDGRTIVGIDPGEEPGIAVLSGDRVVATYQVPPERVADVVHEEIAGAPDPLVRIGDGARLVGARIIDELDDIPVELVDETGTTPYLGAGTRGVADVVAAINIARIEGEPVEERDIEPTAGELKRIKEQSREQSVENRAIDGNLARRVAAGELTIAEALAKHRESTE